MSRTKNKTENKQKKIIKSEQAQTHNKLIKTEITITETHEQTKKRKSQKQKITKTENTKT